MRTKSEFRSNVFGTLAEFKLLECQFKVDPKVQIVDQGIVNLNQCFYFGVSAFLVCQTIFFLLGEFFDIIILGRFTSAFAGSGVN